MSKLLTNGCSMTWGSGLNPDTRVVDTYPHKLHKLLDTEELTDLSQPGVSCQYVVRTTIDFFLDRLEEDLSDYIVFLQMPSGFRLEYWDDVHKHWSYRMIGDGERTIVDYFGIDTFAFYNITNNIMQIGNFLKENQIEYYISTCGRYFRPLLEVEKIKKRIEYIETNYNIFGNTLRNSDLQGLGRSGEDIYLPDDGHWNEKGHTIIADNIYEFINDR